MLSNLIRVGVVEELDEANARVKVSVSGLVSDWLPWGTDSAGRVRKWSPKQVGEQVVLFAPYGDLSQSVVGFSLFQDAHPAPGASRGQETAVFADGTTVDYNMKSNTLTITVAGAGNVNVNCKVATVTAETSVTVDTPQTTCTGNLKVDGNIKADGEITDHTRSMQADRLIYNGHKHGSSPVPDAQQ